MLAKRLDYKFITALTTTFADPLDYNNLLRLWPNYLLTRSTTNLITALITLCTDRLDYKNFYGSDLTTLFNQPLDYNLVRLWLFCLQPTMYLQKSGLDIETFTAATWQLWFGAGLFLINFFINFIILFLKSISTGRDQQQIPCPSQIQNVSGNPLRPQFSKII